MAEEKKNLNHSNQLFKNSDGGAIIFFMRPCNERQELRPIIEHGGGRVTSKLTSGCLKLAEKGSIVHLPDYISTRFVEECVKHNKLVDMEPFKIQSGSITRARTPSGESSHKSFASDDSMSPAGYVVQTSSKAYKVRTKYSKEEDIAILTFLVEERRYNEAMGKKVWKDMEMLKVTDHSADSMNGRYRKTILPNLDRYKHDIHKSWITKLTGTLKDTSKNTEPEITFEALFAKRKKAVVADMKSKSDKVTTNNETSTKTSMQRDILDDFERGEFEVSKYFKASRKDTSESNKRKDRNNTPSPKACEESNRNTERSTDMSKKQTVRTSPRKNVKKDIQNEKISGSKEVNKELQSKEKSKTNVSDKVLTDTEVDVDMLGDGRLTLSQESTEDRDDSEGDEIIPPRVNRHKRQRLDNEEDIVARISTRSHSQRSDTKGVQLESECDIPAKRIKSKRNKSDNKEEESQSQSLLEMKELSPIKKRLTDGKQASNNKDSKSMTDKIKIKDKQSIDDIVVISSSEETIASAGNKQDGPAETNTPDIEIINANNSNETKDDNLKDSDEILAMYESEDDFEESDSFDKGLLAMSKQQNKDGEGVKETVLDIDDDNYDGLSLMTVSQDCDESEINRKTKHLEAIETVVQMCNTGSSKNNKKTVYNVSDLPSHRSTRSRHNESQSPVKRQSVSDIFEDINDNDETLSEKSDGNVTPSNSQDKVIVSIEDHVYRDEVDKDVEECREICRDVSRQFDVSSEFVRQKLYQCSGDVDRMKKWMNHGDWAPGATLWSERDDEDLQSNTNHGHLVYKHGEDDVNDRIIFLQGL